MGFSGFGLYADATSNLSISLPIACYTLDGMERAIARQAKANSAFWTAVGRWAHGRIVYVPSGRMAGCETDWRRNVALLAE